MANTVRTAYELDSNEDSSPHTRRAISLARDDGTSKANVVDEEDKGLVDRESMDEETR